jgi:hypothetical protein
MDVACTPLESAARQTTTASDGAANHNGCNRRAEIGRGAPVDVKRR